MGDVGDADEMRDRLVEWTFHACPFNCPFSRVFLWKRLLSPLSSRPKRTRISYFALLATTTCAALQQRERCDQTGLTLSLEVEG